MIELNDLQLELEKLLEMNYLDFLKNRSRIVSMLEKFEANNKYTSDSNKIPMFWEIVKKADRKNKFI